jgi:hypothetical protein
MNVNLQKLDRQKHPLYIIAAMVPRSAILIACVGGGSKQGANAKQERPQAYRFVCWNVWLPHWRSGVWG